MKFSKALLFLIFILSVVSCKKEIHADILIQNGTVYDGVNSIPNNFSIAIKDDKIIFLGNENMVSINASKVIDATGLIVSPGFIDPHTHADRDLINPEESHNKPFLFQGVTTVVVGNDGDSFYPSSKYIDLYKQHGIGTNAVLLVGHGTIREKVLGKNNRTATTDEIIKMQKLIQQEMNTGAFGLSTGLFYSPGSYSETDEVVELAKIVSKNDGIYDTHLRDESSYTVGLISAIEEAIEIGEKAKLPVHISHIKCLGVDVWSQSDSIIKIIENAQKKGVQVTANQYPYEASATGLQAAVVPRWTESGGKDSMFIRYDNLKLRQQILDETKKNITRRGGPDKLLFVKSDDSIFVGKHLLEVSNILKVTPEEAVFKTLRNSYVRIASFNMNSDDISNFMKQDWVVTGSDGNTGHPRKYGTFPRKYHKYVKQEKVINMASFIMGSTSKTADIFKIPNRGRLQVGYYADIIIFNPETFCDKADYTDAFKYSKGLEYSIINGKISVESEKYTGLLNGKVLKKNKAL